MVMMIIIIIIKYFRIVIKMYAILSNNTFLPV
jgi:hypothetical protein